MDDSGILNLNKPAGDTSFSLVALVRRLSGVRRVGHAGTLDPIATGVLPVLLGQATRMVEFLQQQPKTYRAEFELGTATDTYDITGRTVYKGDATGISAGQIEEALCSFRGVTSQCPPMHSAVRLGGVRLYELARAGLEVERQSRPVVIYETRLLAFEPPLATVEIVCGKGTYIRAVAHDIGQLLGCGACLRALSRLRYGPFRIDNAIPLADLEEALRRQQWRHLVLSMDSVLADTPAITLDPSSERLVANGQALPTKRLGVALDGGLARAYGSGGRLVAVLTFHPDSQSWRPSKVFSLGK